MSSEAPNLLKPHHLPYVAGGLAVALTVAVFGLSLSGFIPGSVSAAAPTFSGGGPTDGATAQAVDVAVSIVSDVALGPASLGTWTSQTSGVSTALDGFFAFDANTAWAVGASGVILKTANAGTTWSAQTSGTSTGLLAVTAADANTAWAVGNSGTILKTSNGGTSWSAQTSGTANNLRGVTCTSTSTCYAVGGTGSDFIILKTTDGGSNWSSKASGTNVSISSVGCADLNTCWFPKNGGGLAKTTDGGDHFPLLTSGTSNNLNGVAVTSSSVVYIVGASGTIIKTTDGGTNWSTQTSNTTNTLNGISCLSTTVCWAVGDSGTVLYTADGGTTWASQTSNTSVQLKAMRGISAISAWLVGASGTIHVFAYNNNVLLQTNTGNTQAGAATGSNLCTAVTLSNSDKTITCTHADLTKNTWYTFTITTGVKNTSGEALAANATRAFRVIGAPALSTAAVTDGQFGVATDAALTADFDNPLSVTSFLGTTWTTRTVSGDLGGVHLIDASTAVAVGASGVTLTTTDGSAWIPGTTGSSATLNDTAFVNPHLGFAVGNSGTILKTLDLARSWTAQTSGTAQNLKSVACADALTCWTVGASGVILKTTNGGSTWTAQTSGTSETLFGLHAVSTSVVYAVGNSNKVLKTTNGGTTWTATSVTGNHGDVFCTSATVCWIASDTGLVYRTTDGGTNWTAATPEANATWNSIAFASSTTGWVVGNSGKIYKSTDGGVNWVQETSGTSGNLTDVSFVSATTGVGIGATGIVLKTTDGGTTWTLASSGTTQTLMDVFFPFGVTTGWTVGVSGTILRSTNNGMTWAAQTSGTSASLQDVFALSANTAWVVGSNGTILNTTNSGTTWSAQTSGTSNLLNAISCGDGSTCVAVGGTSGNTVAVKTSNGGTSWSALTTGATDFLSGVAFVDTSVGWVVGASGSIRKTTDGGSNWSAQTSNTSNHLNGISCASSSVCVVVGDSGTILSTTNGGTAWTTRTSGVSTALYDVGYVDANTFWVVGTSGVILKTTDGGASWTAQTSGISSALMGVRTTSSGTVAWAVGGSGSGVIISPQMNITLQTNAGVARSGTVGGGDYCQSITLGSDGSGNANRRLTCTHGALAGGAWYTLVLTGGATGLASTSALTDVLAANATRAFRTAFASGQAYDLAASDMGSLATNGYFTVTGSNSAATQAVLGSQLRTTVSTTDGIAQVTVPQNATFTRTGGGTFDLTALAMSDYTSSATNVTGTKRAVIQYGIPNVSMTLGTAATMAIPVPTTVVDGTVLNVYRDTDGNFSDSTTVLTTCTVSLSTCTFTTTSLSYFAVSEGSGSPTQTDTTAPAVPTIAAATSSGGKVTVTWTDPADADLATIRILQIAAQSGATTLRGTVAKGVQTFTDSGTDLVVGTAYTYGIQAEDTSGNRSTAATVTVTVSGAPPAAADTTPPAAPSNFTATSANSKVTLHWIDPTDADLKSIRVLLIRGEATTLRSTLDKAIQAYTDTSSDLIAGLPFTYALEAEDTSGNRSPRTTVTVTVVGGSGVVDTTAPAVPSNVQATSADGKVTLTWIDPTDSDLSTVRILLVQGATTTLRGTVAKGAKTYTDAGTDLMVGTGYTYKLEAEDTSGNRSARATVTVTVLGALIVVDTTPPAPPTAVEATSADRIVTLSWIDPADADLKVIRVLLVRGVATTIRGTVAKGIQKYVDTGSDLKAEERLTYKLEAEDVSGNRSTPISVMVTVASEPPPPPPPPTVDDLVRTNAPCRALLTVAIRGHLIDAFSRTQGRALKSARDLLFFCSLLADPSHPSDPTKLYPEYRDEQAETLALKNFVNFFGRPPSEDTSGKPLATTIADKDWWAVKYMAYHLRLLPTARDLDGERACLKLFLSRDVDLYKDGVKVRKAKGVPPKDLFDYDFTRACTYSGVRFVKE